MAKSVRASVSKRNKAKLRATVFGPAVDARTERLSAKLQELASQPKPSTQDDSNAENKTTEMEDNDGAAQVKLSDPSEDMDIDKPSAKSSHKSGRIHKRHSNRKNRSSIVFRSHPSKAKKGSKRK
ncbi:hypothetical protein P170DRAFT_475829 [Aspergillus steynii IBT 23096]|uniref:DUF2423 domain-containing protein n=1 Tax=Aspergillus steynii IBT 23096 TaxID=1392250 RepID=A0A2I2G9J3_9EURO|nr:uncharacterized protein P170DRAFT_475829 [Aspergillus steynii IBT 23096]PLB49538.1 hypothetical protein P170DRAFT_475829 [Aspergillus steynii IBT 23096]